ncbi:MAG: cytochrome ubiquinol oxidase subunit I [Nitrospirota bacterium]|nr:cytochrome ubiquinol oxidase subunit I [Nitrospirota bacterium]MDH5587850.1 cytochrome ubiquinol oxidase subunit I [Nitrospirota bacterium]MDH5774060.1 cytochrome ubiquinol oxidase subunit I [Nitrospirota bacterium]
MRSANHIQKTNAQSFLEKMPVIFKWVSFVSVLLLPVIALAAGAETKAMSVEYRDVPGIGSRNLVWIVAQQHLLLAGFVLGVPIFGWVCELVGWKTKEARYDKLAKEFTKLLTSAYATTALFGGILLFLLIGLYPKLMAYLTDMFFPSFLVYCLLFLAETATLYMYWYGWDYMQGNKKAFHLFLGFLLNLFAIGIMIVPNSWATFQASPVVVGDGDAWTRAWMAMQNPTWWPVNIHRLIANVVLGGFIVGAYAGIRYLLAVSREEREHYDWMGYVGNFIGVFGMLPLPFAGYWLMREVYQYNQQMGITLMGGFLAWLFILQAMLIGVLFLGANYYFWMGITYRIPGSENSYKKPIMAMLVLLLLCLGVWMTPHSLVASLAEAQKMGGTHHPLLGVFGVMSAKMTVSNLMILVTFMSFIMYWRAGKQETAGWAKAAKAIMGALLVIGGVAVIVLGVWGYFVPAIIRINYFSVAQVLIVLFIMVTFTPLTALLMKSAKTTTEMVWGQMPIRAGYSLVLNAVMVILLMSLMGYARSSSRVHWHIYGVMRDTSDYAFSPALGYAAAFMSLNTFVYCLLVAFIFWVATLGDKAKAQQTKSAPDNVPGGAPVMAGGAPSRAENIESGILENHK